MSGRIDISYRRHRIIAGDGKAGPAWSMTAGAKLHESRGTIVAGALESARGWIDHRLDGQRANRRLPYVGTKEEYLRALQGLSIGAHHEVMLRAHATAPDRTLTAAQLACAAGYGSYEAANAHYGRLGRQVAEYLDLSPPTHDQRGETIWTLVIAAGADEPEGVTGGGRWIPRSFVLCKT